MTVTSLDPSLRHGLEEYERLQAKEIVVTDVQPELEQLQDCNKPRRRVD